jgi:hypothetical protein
MTLLHFGYQWVARQRSCAAASCKVVEASRT